MLTAATPPVCSAIICSGACVFCRIMKLFGLMSIVRFSAVMNSSTWRPDASRAQIVTPWALAAWTIDAYLPFMSYSNASRVEVFSWNFCWTASKSSMPAVAGSPSET